MTGLKTTLVPMAWQRMSYVRGPYVLDVMPRASDGASERAQQNFCFAQTFQPS